MCRLPQTGIHGTRAFSTVLLVFPVLIFTVLLTIGPGHAASGSDDVITVSLPVGDDLYFAGGRVVVSKTVKGDLLAAGGTVIINGPVGGDLIIAGGSLFVNAPVKDDLRAVGGDLVLSSPVSGDLLVLGGYVTVPAGVVVEGDAVIAAGSLYLGGTGAGDLLVQAGDLELDGTVQGNARLYATDRISLRGRVEGETVFSATRAELGPRRGAGWVGSGPIPCAVSSGLGSLGAASEAGPRGCGPCLS
ncbi:MAG: hypothetical protein JSV00_09240, partial [bacterium]